MYILTKLIFFLPALIFLISIFIFYSPFLQHMKGNLLHLNGKSFLLQKLDFYLAKKKKILNNFLFACLNIACEFLNLPTTLSKDIFFQFFFLLFQYKQIENSQNVLLLFISEKHFLLFRPTPFIFIHPHIIRFLSSLFFPNQLI